MAERLRFGLGDLLLWLLIVAAAAGTRAGYLLTCADSGRTPGPLRVQDDRGVELEQLITHNVGDIRFFRSQAPLAGDVEETAHTAPGYPWLRAQARRFLHDNEAAIVRWAQCGLGALAAGFYFLFARRAFNSRFVGVLAGLLCAIYPFWIANCAELDDGTLTSFLLGAGLWLGTRGAQVGGAMTSLVFGLTLAGLALVRATALPFAFLAVLWYLLACRHVPRGWLYALLAFLGFANGLAPWTMRTLQVQGLGDVVPLVDSAYYHLWTGNNPKATGGPLSEQRVLEALAELRGEAVTAIKEELAGKPQLERYHSLAASLWQEVQAHPAATIQRRLAAGASFLLGEEWFRNQRLWQGTDPNGALPESTPEWFVQSYEVALYGSVLTLFLLAPLGWRWSYAWRRQTRLATFAVLWLPLPYLLSHAELLQGPRLPLDGVLLTYAALAIACWTPGVRPGLRASWDK